jgi:hypothetical protein
MKISEQDYLPATPQVLAVLKVFTVFTEKQLPVLS